MQRIRVGAANGLGIKYLARQDASSVGILGSGWQAGAQLMAVCAVREIKTIRCFSPNRERREAFALETSGMLGVEVVPVAQPEDALRGADIAMCATNSIDNIFFERWIEPGMHLSSIKITEIELAAIRRADRLVLHTHDDKPLHVTTAGLQVAEKRGSKGWALGQGIDFARTPTIAEVIASGTPVRRADSEVTCFLNNLGLGYQFAAAGAVVYRKAKEAGLGHDLPTDWFTQDVHP